MMWKRFDSGWYVSSDSEYEIKFMPAPDRGWHVFKGGKHSGFAAQGSYREARILAEKIEFNEGEASQQREAYAKPRLEVVGVTAGLDAVCERMNAMPPTSRAEMFKRIKAELKV